MFTFSKEIYEKTEIKFAILDSSDMTEIPFKYDMAKLEVQEALEFCIDSSGFQFPADSFRMRPKLDKERSVNRMTKTNWNGPKSGP